MTRHLTPKLLLGALALAAPSVLPATSALAAGAPMGGPPMAGTAYATSVVSPSGGMVSGFGITATFAPGAVSAPSLVILSSWPSGLDVPAPMRQSIVKTFGLQVCPGVTALAPGVKCTSASGNYPQATPGTERIDGVTVSTSGYLTTGVNFGTAVKTTTASGMKTPGKLVTFTIATGATSAYIYNPFEMTTSTAYPKLLPSTASNGMLTFQTFQPIVWALTIGTPTAS